MWSTFWSFAQHHWSAGWEPCSEPDGHIGVVKLKHAVALFGRMLPGLDLDVTAKQVRGAGEDWGGGGGRRFFFWGWIWMLQQNRSGGGEGWEGTEERAEGRGRMEGNGGKG